MCKIGKGSDGYEMRYPCAKKDQKFGETLKPKQNEIIIVIEVPPFYLYCKGGAIVEQN